MSHRCFGNLYLQGVDSTEHRDGQAEPIHDEYPIYVNRLLLGSLAALTVPSSELLCRCRSHATAGPRSNKSKQRADKSQHLLLIPAVCALSLHWLAHDPSHCGEMNSIPESMIKDRDTRFSILNPQSTKKTCLRDLIDWLQGTRDYTRHPFCEMSMPLPSGSWTRYSANGILSGRAAPRRTPAFSARICISSLLLT